MMSLHLKYQVFQYLYHFIVKYNNTNIIKLIEENLNSKLSKL